uniref:metal ABC transporter permease n=1 Tax=Pararhizobium sp. IMCC3301 TaxID=3067904 RepID=UPI0035319247
MNTMLEFFWVPFSFPFMQQAFLITVLIAAAAALLSCFLVLKGWALMGDAVSHAVLPGVVVSFVLGIPVVVGAFLAGMLCALAAGYIQENSRVKQDTVLGVVFSGMFGLGLVMYLKVETNVHLDHILFGNMLGLTPQDIVLTSIIAIFTMVVILAKRRDFLLFSFDPQHAGAIGLPVRVLHYGLLMLLSLTVVGALSAVGIILSIALVIAPGSIAFLLTDRFDRMLLYSVLIAVFSSIVGIFASFHLDSAPAPTIVVLMALLFVVVFLLGPKSGVLRKPASF